MSFLVQTDFHLLAFVSHSTLSTPTGDSTIGPIPNVTAKKSPLGTFSIILFTTK